MKLVNKILEVDGLPLEWLKEKEQANAKKRMKIFEFYKCD